MASHHNTNRSAPTRPPHTGQPHGAACICHRCAPGVAARLAAAYVAQRGTFNGVPVPVAKRAPQWRPVVRVPTRRYPAA